MKALFFSICLIPVIAAFSLHSTGYVPVYPCNNYQDTTPKNQRYVYKDITTGDVLNLKYNTGQRSMINTKTGKPVDFYINSTTGDTISGRGGYIVNNYLLHQQDNSYLLDTSRVSIRNNRYYMTQGNTELKMDKGWPKRPGSGRDSM